jgi:aspartyl protease family protein
MRWALVFVVLLGVCIGAIMPVQPPIPAHPTATAATHAAQPEADRPIDTLITRDDNGHFFAHAEVNGEPVRFIVDTGADMVALTVEDARRAGVQFSPAQFQPIGKSASGVALGQSVMLDSIVLDGKRVTGVKAAVVDGLEVSLLGQSYLSKLQSVEMHGDSMTLR